MIATRPNYQFVLEQLNLLDVLDPFEPMVIGTPPLGIDIETSDIDIACTSDDLEPFKSYVMERFGSQAEFSIAKVAKTVEEAIRASFVSHGWEIELFCQALPVHQQHGVRHFLIEKRLLGVAPSLKAKVIELKQSGQKTEPAFATLLKLDGDPYEAMFDLEDLSDEELVSLAG